MHFYYAYYLKSKEVELYFKIIKGHQDKIKFHVHIIKSKVSQTEDKKWTFITKQQHVGIIHDPQVIKL